MVFGTHSEELPGKKKNLRNGLAHLPKYVLVLTGDLFCIYCPEVPLLSIVCVGWRPFSEASGKMPFIVHNQFFTVSNCP